MALPQVVEQERPARSDVLADAIEIGLKLGRCVSVVSPSARTPPDRDILGLLVDEKRMQLGDCVLPDPRTCTFPESHSTDGRCVRPLEPRAGLREELVVQVVAESATTDGRRVPRVVAWIVQSVVQDAAVTPVPALAPTEVEIPRQHHPPLLLRIVVEVVVLVRVVGVVDQSLGELVVDHAVGVESLQEKVL